MSQQVRRSQTENVLSASQCAAFKRDGFLIVRGLCSAAQMAKIGRWTEEVAAWPEAPGKAIHRIANGKPASSIASGSEFRPLEQKAHARHHPGSRYWQSS